MAYNSGGGERMPLWNISGQYYETCSCDFVCPCLPGGMAVNPTRGWFTFAMAFQIDGGEYANGTLEDLGFTFGRLTPAEMVKGNGPVGRARGRGVKKKQGKRTQR